jgi:hypothetical protein
VLECKPKDYKVSGRDAGLGKLKRSEVMKLKCLLIVSPLVAVALMLAANAIATPIEYVATLSGAKEVPPNASPGTGSVTAIFDFAAHTLDLQVTFSGLTSPTIAAHIHAPTPFAFGGTAGVATQVPFFDGFPIGVTSGTYDHMFNTLDPLFYNPTFLAANGGTAAGAEAVLAQALATGRAYFNIHTDNFPSGEIRGFLHVPDTSSTMVCFGAGLIGLEIFRRKFRRQIGAGPH